MSLFRKSSFLLKLSNIADNLIDFTKLQNIATGKLLGRTTAGSGDIEEITLGTNLSLSGTTLNAGGGDTQSSVTLSGNVTYAKANFGGSNILFLKTNNTTTRSLTISNTGFVANDPIMLLIDQNSLGNIDLEINSRFITGNRGNIIQAIFDGTNWHVWTGGGVFNTSNTQYVKTAFGLGANASGAESTASGYQAISNNTSTTAFGRSAQATGLYASAFGRTAYATGEEAGAFGLGANANAKNSNIMGFICTANGYAHTSLFGSYGYGRIYGEIYKSRLDINTSFTDETNPSSQTSFVGWTGTTTNATITELFLRGVSSNRCVLQAKNEIGFSGQAIAFRSDYTGSAKFTIEGLIKRGSANNTTLVGVTTTLTHSDGTGSTLVLTIDADDTNESLRVRVTGNASETWQWLVKLELLDLRIA